MITRTLALFPGQGSQHVGMAKELLNDFPLARETFEEASDAIRVDLKKLCLDGPESDLTLTENTQPCLLTASVAAFRVAQKETGFKPDAVAGHSLGEYSALVVAQSVSLGVAAAWVKERGRAMQSAVPAGQGTMAAVMGLTDEQVTEICKQATALAAQKRATRSADSPLDDLTVDAVVETANFNAPGQVVIAGSIDAVAEAVALVKGGTVFSGGKAIALSVSAPFHCRLMKPARIRMSEVFGNTSTKPQALLYPYIPNTSARITQEAGVVLDLLIEQIDHPVFWKQSMLHALERGTERVVEFGPGKVLIGLMKRIAQSVDKPYQSLNVSDSSGIHALEIFTQGQV